jgi:hypothetical protein
MEDAASYPIRQFGAKPSEGEPQVYVEVGVFAEAILWGKQAAAEDYGAIYGNQAMEPARVVIAECFAAEGQHEDLIELEPVGTVFWRHDGSTALSPVQIAIITELGNPSLSLVLESSRRGWLLYLYSPSKGYEKLSSISIYQKHGTQAGLDKTLSLLSQIPWSETPAEPAQSSTVDEGYHLAKMVHTTRKAFLWGGLLGLFLGALLALVVATFWGGWQVSHDVDRLGFLAGNAQDGDQAGIQSSNEQARTQARLGLERALAGNPDEILAFCTDVVSREQCREALDRLRIAPQHSLSYNPEGVQVSTTVPGLPAYLFRIDTVDGGFRISGVTELTPPVELGIKTVPGEKRKDKKGAEGEKKDAAKPAENGKTTAEQTQIVGGKPVTP